MERRGWAPEGAQSWLKIKSMLPPAGCGLNGWRRRACGRSKAKGGHLRELEPSDPNTRRAENEKGTDCIAHASICPNPYTYSSSLPLPRPQDLCWGLPSVWDPWSPPPQPDRAGLGRGL